MCPLTILKLSLTNFNTGTMALVVQEAAAISLSSSLTLSSLTPKTIFLIFAFPGAVRMTFSMDGFLRCCFNPSSSLQAPVLSISVALLMP